MTDDAASLSASGTTSKKFGSSRKRFQTGSQTYPAAIVVDAEGTIRDMSPAARRLLEYRHEDPHPACFFSHVHARNMYQVMRDVADMVCYGKPKTTWLLQMRTGRGRWRWVRARVTNHLEDDEPAIRVLISDLQE